MDYQKQKILNKLFKSGWLVEESITPQSQNNWKELEVIHLSKNGKSIFFSIEKDPTPGYFGLEPTSKNFDIIIYSEDPLNTAGSDYDIITKINLGKKWEDQLDNFLSKIESYTRSNDRKI